MQGGIGELDAGRRLRADDYTPRQRGRHTVGIAVHEIAEAAEGLTQDQRWGQDIHQTEHRNSSAARKPPDRTGATDYPAVDRQATTPDRRNLPGELVVERPI